MQARFRKLVDRAFGRWQAREDVIQLDEVDRTIVLVWSLTGMIDNAGLDGFYETSTSKYYAENVAALQDIGATVAADVMRRANQVYAQWDAGIDKKDDMDQLQRLRVELEDNGEDVIALLERYALSFGGDDKE